MPVNTDKKDSRLQEMYQHALAQEKADPYNPDLILETDMLALNLHRQNGDWPNMSLDKK
jgi:hypothetical protein